MKNKRISYSMYAWITALQQNKGTRGKQSRLQRHTTTAEHNICLPPSPLSPSELIPIVHSCVESAFIVFCVFFIGWATQA